jgi:hypothetical protein
MSIWRPLNLSLIDEGRFVEQADADLLELQRKLVAFAREYGEQAEGASATLTISVKVKVEDVKSLICSIKANTKISLPPRPGSVTMAVTDKDPASDELCLFVKPSGSDDAPRQRKLCTADGRAIDPATGEVMPAGG